MFAIGHLGGLGLSIRGMGMTCNRKSFVPKPRLDTWTLNIDKVELRL